MCLLHIAADWVQVGPIDNLLLDPKNAILFFCPRCNQISLCSRAFWCGESCPSWYSFGWTKNYFNDHWAYWARFADDLSFSLSFFSLLIPCYLSCILVRILLLDVNSSFFSIIWFMSSTRLGNLCGSTSEEARYAVQCVFSISLLLGCNGLLIPWVRIPQNFWCSVGDCDSDEWCRPSFRSHSFPSCGQNEDETLLWQDDCC